MKLIQKSFKVNNARNSKKTNDNTKKHIVKKAAQRKGKKKKWTLKQIAWSYKEEEKNNR